MITKIEPDEDGIAVFNGMRFRGTIEVCDTGEEVDDS